VTRVLVIEDETDIRNLMSDMLREAGCEVDLAPNGTIALGKMHKHLPDVVVLDLMMPVMDGWGFIETLRTQTKWSQVPILVVSALHELPNTAQRLGVLAALSKPFDIDQLVSEVERLASLHYADRH
jgi:two-component system, chemotaxis family, chemotaxis protein CheY